MEIIREAVIEKILSDTVKNKILKGEETTVRTVIFKLKNMNQLYQICIDTKDEGKNKELDRMRIAVMSDEEREKFFKKRKNELRGEGFSDSEIEEIIDAEKSIEARQYAWMNLKEIFGNNFKTYELNTVKRVTHSGKNLEKGNEK